MDHLSTLLMDVIDEDTAELECSEEALDQYVKSLMASVVLTHRSIKDEDAGPEAEALGSLIMNCAEAISAGNLDKAYCLVNVLRQQSSPTGTEKERLAHYFAEALVSRITGTGSMLRKALSAKTMSEFYEVHRSSAETSPHSGMPVFFTNQTILDHAGGSKLVHVIDFGIGHGFRSLCLLKDFSEQPGGPPHVRITGVELSEHHQGVSYVEVRAKLCGYARQVGVPFEYHAVVSEKWDELSHSDMHVQSNEFLIVTSFYRLRHVPDQARKKFLSNIYSMKPRLFIHAVYPTGCNSPSFLSRMRGAVEFYTGVFYGLGVCYPGDFSVRRFIESIIGLDVLNMVACEGEDRVERPESYKQWQLLVQRAGFKQLPVKPHLIEKAEEMIQTYHESFSSQREGKWLVVRWKKYLVSAMTAWTTL